MQTETNYFGGVEQIVKKLKSDLVNFIPTVPLKNTICPLG